MGGRALSVAIDRVPAWSIAGPLAALGLASLLLGGALHPGGIVLALVVPVIGVAVFSAVHHAELLAIKVGEPFGSILLALAVTGLEVALILVLLLGGAGHDSVARDTVFSAVMIVMNGIVGLCLVLGGRRHGEQGFQLQGAVSALAVLGTLASITLVLPNYTLSATGGRYSPLQLGFVAVVSLALYLVFVFVQAFRHRDYWLDPLDQPPDERPNARITAIAAVMMVAALAGVVLLAEELAHPLDAALIAADLPLALEGIIISAIVLMPEGTSAVRAAIGNRMQTAMNLSLGSAVASIGLTIPVVALASLLLDVPVELGLAPGPTVLLVISLFMAVLTLGTGRTTVLQGAVHLVICAVFLMVTALP
jgi:Ca2+:H+ antiporter